MSKFIFLLLAGLVSFSAIGQTNANIQSKAIRLQNVPLEEVLKLYADVQHRTILQHPALNPTHLSLESDARDKAEVIAAFDAMFRSAGITTIPDGGKFVMVVPTALTNSVSPHSSKIPSESRGSATDRPLPAGMINFVNTPVEHVLQFYSELTGRNRTGQDRLPAAAISIRAATTLSRAEVSYALETLFAWNGIRIIKNDDKTFSASVLHEQR